jgi:hypothetical protein
VIKPEISHRYLGKNPFSIRYCRTIPVLEFQGLAIIKTDTDTKTKNKFLER